MIRLLLVILGLLAVVAVFSGWPAFKRWRDHLSQCPEWKDADRRTKLRLLVSGLRTKMLARFAGGVSAAAPVVNAIGEWLGTGSIDLSAILPAIPLGNGKELVASQYAMIAVSGLTYAFAKLRNLTTTAPGRIDPTLAVAVATNSANVEGSHPSEALAAVTDMASPETDTVRVSGRDRARHQKSGKVRKAA